MYAKKLSFELINIRTFILNQTSVENFSYLIDLKQKST